MRTHRKRSDWVVNLLVAVAISLVVNFSYLVMLLVEPGERQQRQLPDPRSELREQTGVLGIAPDGYGYLVYENGDTLYVPQHRIWRLELSEGDSLQVLVTPPEREGGHFAMDRVLVRNGRPYDLGATYMRPSRGEELAVQLLYFWLVSFILLTILTSIRRRYSMRRFWVRCGVAAAVMAALYFLAPVIDWRTGRMEVNFMHHRMFDYMLVLKCSFAAVVSMLFAHIYMLLTQRQAIVLENEKLKNENLSTRYNMLVGQINPHFLFNSLNSLAMLVREKEDRRALTYIDQLSYTFRYIIQNGQSTMITLDEEMKFFEAYSYLLKIRYEDKLFFDVDIEDNCRGWILPALSLQPLLGNAVKHNVITKAKPLRVTIRTAGGVLEISNPKAPMSTPEPSTGIGLENLNNRWHLIAGCGIEVVDDGATFTVRLPLQQPDKSERG